MTIAEPRPDLERVPTLTEVVVVEPGADVTHEQAAVPPVAAADLPPAGITPPAPATVVIDEDKIVARVMAELQRRIDQMFEYRLREALVPALARASDALVAEAREELARTMRDVVARAVSQEASRWRGR